MKSVACIQAVQHVKRMRGGAQSHLMRASDGHYYVVKFQNNPQHVRVLANEFFATRLAEFLGLPVPDVQIIEVSDSLIESSPGLRFEIDGILVRCAAGLHVGVRHVADLWNDFVFHYLPESIFHRVVNRRAFACILAFDKWAGNSDGRQAVFTKQGRGYHVTFIDQGHCFNAGEWDFPDLPLHGAYYKDHAYVDVTGWDSFEPVLSRIETMEYADLWRCAAPIPLDWFEHDGKGLFQLIEALHQRRAIVRGLITAFRNSSRNPFPRWTAACSVNPYPRSSIKEEERCGLNQAIKIGAQ
jgi:HipA-like protein